MVQTKALSMWLFEFRFFLQNFVTLQIFCIFVKNGHMTNIFAFPEKKLVVQPFFCFSRKKLDSLVIDRKIVLWLKFSCFGSRDKDFLVNDLRI